MRPLRIILLLLLAWLCPRLALAGALYDPALSWRTITTEHFEIHYPEGLKSVAERVARIAEEVHPTLVETWGWAPEHPTQVVVIDNTDFANGSATIAPYNIIRMFVASPAPPSSLDHYDEWLRTLFIHEYSHILHMDQAFGLPWLARFVLGKYVGLNGLSPQWVTEGLATYAETMHSGGGRGDSAYVDMIIRTAALADEFPGLDQANVLYDHWPGGNIAYYFGVGFWQFLRDHYADHEAIRNFTHRYATFPVPYLYYLHAKLEFGAGFPWLWERWREFEVERGVTRQQRIEARGGPTKLRRITFGGGNTSAGRYRPGIEGGKRVVLYSRASPVDGATLRLVTLDNDGARLSDETLVKRAFPNAVNWSAGGERYYYSQVAPFENFWFHNDLFVRDLPKKRTRLLRELRGELKVGGAGRGSLRAREPAVTADGQHLAYVIEDKGETGLVLSRLQVDEDNALLHREWHIGLDGSGRHFAGPAFSPDGEVIAVGVRRPNHARDIHLYRRRDGALLMRVTDDGHEEQSPSFSPDGRWLLFSSNRGGVFNVYAYDLDAGRFYQATDVVSGAFAPELSPDGSTLLVRGYTPKGFDLFEADFEPAQLRPRDDFAPVALGEAAEAPAPESGETVSHVIRSDEPYSPLSTVLPGPGNWNLIPNGFINEVEAIGALTTFGWDALQEHRWFLNLTMGEKTRELGFTASYVYDGLWPTFSISGGRSLVRYPGAWIQRSLDPSDTRLRFIGDGTFIEERWLAALGVSWPYETRHRFGISYVHDFRQGVRGPPRRSVEFKGTLPRRGRFNRLRLGYGFGELFRFPFSVSAEDGRRLSLSLEIFNEFLGANFNEVLLTADVREYLAIPWGDNHVLALRVAGGLAAGEEVELYRLGGAFGDSFFTTVTDKSYPLRGFPGASVRGQAFWLGSLEYRFPIWQSNRGLWDLPLYLDKLHTGFFVDAGHAFSRRELDDAPGEFFDRTRVGAGAELRANFSFGWTPPLTGRLGFAWQVHGGTREAAPSYYLELGSAF